MANATRERMREREGRPANFGDSDGESIGGGGDRADEALSNGEELAYAITVDGVVRWVAASATEVSPRGGFCSDS